MNITPVLLIILDGYGYRVGGADNAIGNARKPNLDRYWSSCPHTTINASELHVGLPPSQMGNSEVGHLNIGAGRVVFQEFTRIELAAQKGELGTNPALARAIQVAKEGGTTLHVMGLLSPGGVHSHENHIHAMVESAVKAGLTRVAVHAFLDGRDTPPRSAEASLAALQAKLDSLGAGIIATVVGRFYAMDRDKRWERTRAAYDLLTAGTAEYTAETAVGALHAAYARGENDEFVKPTRLATPSGEPAVIRDGDAVVFMNFRADRARQITRALTEPSFDGFPRERTPRIAYFCMLTSYGEEFRLPVAYEPQRIANCLGEYLAAQGLRQLRIAETEKYPHVTYFFNGGIEQPYPNEDRVLVASPKVATYDLQPEMSAAEVTDRLVEAIASRRYDAIICNYANADMVGHTGDLAAAIRAIEALDACVGRAVEAMRAVGGEVLITADHGNAEMMLDPETGQAHTAHTTNVVPFIYVGREAGVEDTGALADIAPTMLRLMGLPQPPDMTGKSLIRLP